jgi:hypothetical protein
VVPRSTQLFGAVALTATLASCGRIGFDYLDLQTSDAGDAIDATEIPTIDDEAIVLPDGWSAEVWFDFSDSFTFDPNDYLDDGVFLYTNRPHHMFLLSPPFAPGLGLMGNQEILELSADRQFARHDYFQVLPQGPDLIWDAQACGGIGTTSATEGLCVAAGSQLGGDGIFRVESDWSMSVITTDNNVTVMAYDETGTFDSAGAPTLYWGGPNGMRPVGGSLFYNNNMNGGFARMLDNGNMLLSSVDATSSEGVLVSVESGTHQVTELARTATTPDAIPRMNNLYFSIVEGDRDGFGGMAHVIEEGKRLARVEVDGSLTVIASTDVDDDWIWVAGVSPGAGHAIADPGPGIFILEFNPTTEVNRVIRLAP